MKPVVEVNLLLLWMCLALTPWMGVHWAAEACSDTAWQHGTLDTDEIVGRPTMATPGADTCTCCALCHKNPACASLSFSAASGECRLYGSVASYASLTPSDEWRYLVMPGRSEHHQFCRRDSDCQAADDRCRGRVCTTLEKVTCRDIHETLGAGDKYGLFVGKMYGWFKNNSYMFACLMSTDTGGGYTLLFRNTNGFRFDRTNIWDFNQKLEEDGPYSILHLAEALRQSGNTPTYSIRIVMLASPITMAHMKVPRAEAVISDTLRTTGFRSTFDPSAAPPTHVLSLPYAPSSGEAVLTTNGIAPIWLYGALARTTGEINWFRRDDTVYLFIRE